MFSFLNLSVCLQCRASVQDENGVTVTCTLCQSETIAPYLWCRVSATMFPETAVKKSKSTKRFQSAHFFPGLSAGGRGPASRKGVGLLVNGVGLLESLGMWRNPSRTMVPGGQWVLVEGQGSAWDHWGAAAPDGRGQWGLLVCRGSGDPSSTVAPGGWWSVGSVGVSRVWRSQ